MNCIFNYEMDLWHFGGNVLGTYSILGQKNILCLINANGCNFCSMLLLSHEDKLQFETKNNSFHTNSSLGNSFEQLNNFGIIEFWSQTLYIF